MTFLVVLFLVVLLVQQNFFSTDSQDRNAVVKTYIIL